MPTMAWDFTMLNKWAFSAVFAAGSRTSEVSAVALKARNAKGPRAGERYRLTGGFHGRDLESDDSRENAVIDATRATSEW
jgi:hypothetical protein